MRKNSIQLNSQKLGINVYEFIDIASANFPSHFLYMPKMASYLEALLTLGRFTTPPPSRLFSSLAQESVYYN